MTNHPNRSGLDWNNPWVSTRALENASAGRATREDVEALVKAINMLLPAHMVSIDAQHGAESSLRNEECKKARRALVQLASR